MFSFFSKQVEKKKEDTPKISPIELAIKSNAVVKLYLDDGSDIVVDIPIESLWNDSTTEKPASYKKIHESAITALFIYAPDRKVPDYAWKDFNTRLSYVDENGKKIDFATDAELTKALEWGANTNLFDDNDGAILQVYCKIVSRLPKKEQDDIEVAATAVVQNVIKTAKGVASGIKKHSIKVKNYAKDKTEFDLPSVEFVASKIAKSFTQTFGLIKSALGRKDRTVPVTDSNENTTALDQWKIYFHDANDIELSSARCPVPFKCSGDSSGLYPRRFTHSRFLYD